MSLLLLYPKACSSLALTYLTRHVHTVRHKHNTERDNSSFTPELALKRAFALPFGHLLTSTPTRAASPSAYLHTFTPSHYIGIRSVLWLSVQFLTICLPLHNVVTPNSTEYVALRQHSLDGLAKRSMADMYALLRQEKTVSSPS
jgi:hypothetical protein